MKILVSACLMGFRCRYDGEAKLCSALDAIAEHNILIPFCPEIYGGLPTPRPCAEISGERVITESGDVTAQYTLGAEQALYAAESAGCELCILKERSPSCGHGYVYDGSFTGKLIPGDGFAAALLLRAGYTVIGESDIPKFFTPDGVFSANI